MFKKIVFFVFLSTFSSFVVCSPNNMNQDNENTKISINNTNKDIFLENKQGKDFEVRKINEDLYASQFSYGDQTLYIGLQRITQDTYPQWHNFTTTEEKFVRENSRISINLDNSSRPVSSIKVGLEYFEYPVKVALEDDSTNVWVAYISEDPITQSIDKCNLILVVTVSAGEKVPFTTHMGIFKTSYETLGNKYKNISMYLHSFAGYLANQLFKGHPQKKEYMATTPADNMRKIMINAMGGSNEIYKRKFYIGDKEVFLKWKVQEKEEVKKLSFQELKQEYPEKTDKELREMQRNFLIISDNKKRIKEYFPLGMANAPEPPLDCKSQYDWSFKLKEGKIIDFEPTPINREQSKQIVPWVITDLDVLSKLYDWNLIQESNENK